MLSSSNQCAIVVSSFDGFADIWEPFFTLLFRYWPDCPYHIYLISNFKRFDHPRVTTLPIGDDGKWANNLFAALERISATHIIYMQEDFFLTKPVDSLVVQRIVEHAIKNNIAAMHLFPGSSPDLPYHESGLGMMSSQMDYRVSLQAVLWDVRKLKALMRKCESGWDMEIQGTERTRQSGEIFLSVKEAIIDYVEGTTKGKWNIAALWHCWKESVRCDLKAHGVNYDRFFRAQHDRFRKSVKRLIGLS